MAHLYLDRDSVIPLYHQLSQHLRNEITSGVYQRGQTFPSENVLMKRYSVSRNTVRQALDSLVGMGLIQRQQGRGTFVASSRVLSQSGALSSFTEEVERMGAKPGVVLLDTYQQEAPIKVSEELRLPPSVKVMCVVRLRTADEQPICVATSWLNSVDFEELEQADYNQLSLYNLYENVTGRPVFRATQQVWADPATTQEAKTLKISRGSPVLRFARTTYVASDEAGGTPIEYVEAAFVGERYTLETELHRSAR